jgi:hypothetical protein
LSLELLFCGTGQHCVWGHIESLRHLSYLPSLTCNIFL